MQQSHSSACGLAALLLALAGCASAPGPSTAPGASSPPTAPAPGSTPDAGTGPPGLPEAGTVGGVPAFIAQQRSAARSAADASRWADALWANDVLLALLPGDADALAQRAQAETSIQAALAERLPRARQARQRGEQDRATRLWLEVLALAPQHAEAADALRAIERSRNRRAGATGMARSAQAPRAGAPNANSGANAAGRSNALEHASMLASQGEIDAAIALLQPQAGAPGADAELRSTLADLYLRQGERLARSDKAAAIAALQRCLQLQPQHAQAQQRLKQLRGGP